jgi:hypothetical protein
MADCSTSPAGKTDARERRREHSRRIFETK